jgi:hypothetical protein
VVAAAAELFAADGYARTTWPKSPPRRCLTETVQGQGSKAKLLIASAEYAAVVSGEGHLNGIGHRYRRSPVPPRPDLLVDAQTGMHERSVGAGVGAHWYGGEGDADLDRHTNDLVASITGQDRGCSDLPGPAAGCVMTPVRRTGRDGNGLLVSRPLRGITRHTTDGTVDRYRAVAQNADRGLPLR